MTYSSEVLADSPSAYYRLGESSGTTMVDSSGNGRNGTYSGSPTLGAAGLLVGDSDTCVDFDGVDDYGLVAYAAWMNPASFTAEAIVTPDSVTGSRTMVGRRDANTLGTQSFQFRIVDGKLELLLLYSGANVLTASSTPSLSAGSTYHLAVTYDGANVRLYINGALDTTAPHAGGYNTASSPMRIGGINQGGGAGFEERFDGKIDEVAFYGTALSAGRISAHYAAIAPAPPDAILRADEIDAARTILTFRNGGRYYENPSPSGLITISGASSATETVIVGMDATSLTPGSSTDVTINLWEAMNQNGTLKGCIARLRDGGLGGTVLASHTFTDAGDSTSGHQQQWSYSGTVTPTTDRLSVTIQATAGTPQITSDTRTFVVAQARANASVAVGQTIETDAAQAVTVVRGKLAAPVGMVTETDTATAITPFIAGAMAAIGQAVETDTAQAVAVTLGVVAVPIGQAVETDTAVGWSFNQPETVPIGQALETDTAGTVGITGMYGIAAAFESNEALAVLVVQAPSRNGLGLALDSSAVLTVDAVLEPEPTVPPGTPSTALHIIAPTVPVPTLVAGRPQ